MNDNSTKAPLFALPNIVTPATAALATVTIDAKGRVTAVSAAPTTGSGSVVLATNPVIAAPTIADLSNMTHGHISAATGGSLGAAAIGSGQLALARGGTGVDLSAAGSATAILAQDASHVISARALIAADIPTLTLAKISDAGTMAAQNANNVAVTGGTINGTTLGATTPAAITGTTITANTKIIASRIEPASDSTTAIIMGKAAGGAAVVTVDTSFNTTTLAGILILPAAGSINFGGNLFLSRTGNTYSLQAATNSPGTVFVQLKSSTGVLLGSWDSSGAATTLVSDATAGITNVAILDHVLASGGASAGFGPGLLLRGTSGSAGTTREMGYMYSAWTTSTDLSRASKVVIGTYNVGTAVDVLTITPTTAQINSGSSFITFTPDSGTIRLFYAGTYDGLLTLGSGVLTFNGGFKGTSFGVPSTSMALTQGSLTLFSVGGSDNYISWSEAGAAFRGTLGFKAGSSTLIYRPGVASLASGTTVFSIDSSGIVTHAASDAAAATVTDVAILDHSSSGTPAASYGTGLRFRGQDSTTPSQEMGRVRTVWTDPAHLTRASKMVLSTYAVGTEVDAVTILSDGNVGIGISSPGSKLHISGGSVLLDNAFQLAWKEAGGATRSVLQLFSDNSVYLDATQGIYIRPNGTTVAVSIPVLGGVRVHSDPGSGAASTTTLTNATGTPSNTATPAGYLKVYVGAVASYVPYYQ